MPIPKPKKNEDKDAFISRCVSDKTMKKEYPKKKQRLAVCYQQWNPNDNNTANSIKECEGKNSVKGGEKVDMNKRKLKMPKGGYQFLTDEPVINFSDDDKDDNGLPRSFSMEAYTGAIMPSMFGESIAVDISGIDFGSKKRFPILEEHNEENKIGVANGKPDLNNRVYFDKINILNNEKATEFASNLYDGFPYQSSISVKPKKIEEVPANESADVNGIKFKGPGIILRSSEFSEASVCVKGRDRNTSVEALSEGSNANEENLAEVEVEVINFSEEGTENEESLSESSENQNTASNKETVNNNTGGKNMNLIEEIKQALSDQYPDLVTRIESQFSEYEQSITDKDSQIEQLKNEKQNLSDTNQSYENRIAELEKAEQFRIEKDLKDQANKVIDQSFNEYKIPTRLHDKIRKQFDHNKFVDQNNVLDSENFKQEVDAEVKDWSDAVAEISSTDDKVIGFGDTGENDDEKQQFDSLADSMVKLAVGENNE